MAPAASVKPRHRSSWQGQRTCKSPAPWWGSSPGCPARAPSWHSPGPLPRSVGHKEAHSAFSPTSCAPCTSKDSTGESIREARSIYISKGRKCTVFSPGGLVFSRFPPSPQCCQPQGQGPMPSTHGVAHKTLSTCPAEFIVTGTLLQNSDCSDKWESSNENLLH